MLTRHALMLAAACSGLMCATARAPSPPPASAMSPMSGRSGESGLDGRPAPAPCDHPTPTDPACGEHAERDRTPSPPRSTGPAALASDDAQRAPPPGPTPAGPIPADDPPPSHPGPAAVTPAAGVDADRDRLPVPAPGQVPAPAPAPAAPATGEDADLARLPVAVPGEAEVPSAADRSSPSRLRATLYAEDAATLAARRDAAVAFPPPPPYGRQNRTSLDAIVTGRPRSRLTWTISDRVDVVEQQAIALGSRQTLRNELREAYLGWEPVARSYLEVGRINVRSGAALGFNPTDFLRPRTLVGQASLDPSVLSKNRLGTVMVRAQTIWDGGSASVLYAPKLAAPSAIAASPLAIDPRLEVTNAAHRAIAEASGSFGELSVRTLVYLERRRSRLGLDLTRPLGQSVIAYAEWAGGYDDDLVLRALAYGRDTGTLPAGPPPAALAAGSRGFRSDLAIGGSWTIATAVTVNLEYHLHQAGLSRAAWQRWFDAGRDVPALAGELWYVRGYASDQLEPATMHQAFVRVAWPKAIVDHLELDGIAFVSLVDGSTLAQATASYYLSDAWTAALSASGNLGSARSERGSLPVMASAVLGLVRYL